MLEPGGILLVSLYELGHTPTAVAFPAGFLARAGFVPSLLDLSLDEADDRRLAAASFVALSVPMHTAFRLGLRLAERLRRVNPGAHLCFFGHYAALNAELLFARRLADSVIAGECEEPMTELVQALADGRAPAVAGVRLAGGPLVSPWLKRPDHAVPRRDGLPALERYAALIEGGRKRTAGHVEASRGCKHRCRHCPITPVYDGRFFAVPLEVVLADARAQVEAGATHLSFGDPDFLNGPTHALAVARALHAAHPGLTFDFTAKVEHLLAGRERLAELEQLGCAFVVSAFESLSDRVLERLDKGHTRADIETALDLLDAAGLPVRPSLLPFTPWSTLEEYVELLDWIEDRGLIDSVDPVQLAIRLLVPPGSRLLELAAEGAGVWPGALDAEALTHRWVHADPRMDHLQVAAARIVESAAADGEDPAITLARLRERAAAALGRPSRSLAVPLSAARGDRPPRLAEAWFC